MSLAINADQFLSLQISTNFASKAFFITVLAEPRERERERERNSRRISGSDEQATTTGETHNTN